MNILVPTGIGDIYWVFTKLEAIIKASKISTPEIHVWSPGGVAQHRGLELVKRVSFIDTGNYHNDIKLNKNVLRHPITENVNGFEYYISFNTELENGNSLSEILPQYEPNWYFPLKELPEEKIFGKKLKKKYGKYVFGFFSDHSFLQYWSKHISPEKIAILLNKIYYEYGHKTLLFGEGDIHSGFCKKIEKEAINNNIIDITGTTNWTEALGGIRNSELVIGYPGGGSTIMATILKKPTFIFWEDFFHRNFWVNTCPPDSLNEWYFPLDGNNWKTEFIIEKIGDIL